MGLLIVSKMLITPITNGEVLSNAMVISQILDCRLYIIFDEFTNTSSGVNNII
jgi:hypothetical protein